MLMQRLRRRGHSLALALLTVLAAGVLAVPAAAGAVHGESITISPVSQDFTIAASGSVSGQIEVINDGTVPDNYVSYARPFSVTNEEYQPSFSPAPKIVDASQWFRLGLTSFALQPGQRTEVPYTITVPAGASPGGHYAVAFISTQPQSQQGTIVTQKRVGTIFYLTVAGPTIRGGKVLGFALDHWQTAPPLSTPVRIQNTGNVHFNATVQVWVTDIFGEVKHSSIVTAVVLPQTVRRLPIDWTGAPRFGLFHVSGTAEYLGRTQIIPGQYVLIMSLPFFLALVAAIVVVVAAAIIWRRIQHGHRQ